ncbi:MAG: serpin family protein, partial [Myxococcales bacterium]|nr:serpin family protein [Myxococcales bacterium]
GAPAGSEAPAISDVDHPISDADRTAASAEAKAGNRFGDALYGQLRPQNGNLFMSPLSVRIALAMTYAGARGKTAEEMRSVLAFTADGDALGGAMAALQGSLAEAAPAPQVLAIANRLWGLRGEGFLGEYLQHTRTYYGAALAELDFGGDPEGSRATINAWVAEKTRDRIPELIPKGLIDGSTVLVLTNAIYFKGLWERPCDPAKIAEGDFKVADKTVRAPMMAQKARFSYAEVDDAKVLELPYEGGRLAMVIVLPNAVDGLARVEEKVVSGGLAPLLSGAREREVEVTIPRFNVESSFLLGQVLKGMGMGTAFAGADFSGMNGRQDLQISEVVHKAFVEVNEEGSEAAAATGVVMTRSAVVGPPARFVADHPFLFAIRDRQSEAVLFVGRLVNPNA